MAAFGGHRRGESTSGSVRELRAADELTGTAEELSGLVVRFRLPG